MRSNAQRSVDSTAMLIQNRRSPRAHPRQTGLVSLVTFVLLSPSSVWGQALRSFEDLALRVNLDDQLQIEDQSGSKTVGRLTRLKRDKIAIQSDVGEKRFTSNAVREVAVRGHSFGKGALIGAGVFAVLGAAATCSHEGSADCGIIGPLRAAPIGAGVGLAIGAVILQMKTVYRAPEERISVQPSRAISGASLLEDLALRVNLDDQLRVDDRSGGSATGRLTRLTANEITIQTDAGEKHFTRETVRQVALRHEPIRMAVLIGAGAGAAAGAVAACTGARREECADAPILASAFGAGLGLAVGALIHRTTIVYPEPERKKGTLVLPAISRGAFSVQVSRRW
jgi:hypothetical protein